MAEEMIVSAESRNDSGTGAARNLRREGKLPAVLNLESGEAKSLQLDMHSFTQMLKHQKSEHLMVDLKVDGSSANKVLLKDVQHHPVTGNLLHVDFLEVSMTKKMTIPVSLKVVGDPVGVTQGAGLLELIVREIEVECLPTDLVDQIEVDVSALDIGDALMAGDIKLGEGMDLVTAADIAVVHVSAPKVAVDAGAEGAEGEEGAEPAEGEAAPAEGEASAE